ncbi:MAG: copper chaperone PCu(A)C [Candidatus Puniceispirillaceae bacterium]
MRQPVLASEIMFGPLQFRATVGSMPNSAAYVSITNHGKMADRLIGVTSNLARKTELHKMEMDNGVMKMRQVVGGIDLLAGKTIHLAPGGHHVMLVGLNAPLTADSMFKITLVFQNAGERTLKGMAMLPADLNTGHALKMHKHKHKTH